MFYKKRGFQKRGQTTAFIIIGILLLITTGIVFYVRNIYFDTTDAELTRIEDEVTTLPPLKTYVQQCMFDSSILPVQTIAENGGSFQDTINGYLRQKIVFHENIYPTVNEYKDGSGKVNFMISREWIEKELKNDIAPRVLDCINLSVFADIGYNVSNGSMVVDVVVAVDDIIIRVNYPIKIEKIEDIQEEQTYEARIVAPLGRLYDLANQITNEELERNFFDKDLWMLEHNTEIKIQKHRQYVNRIPYTFYNLSTLEELSNKTYYYYLAIQGVDLVDKTNEQINFNEVTGTTCYSNYYQNCFKNVDLGGQTCEDFNLSSLANTCNGQTVFEISEDVFRPCAVDGFFRKHGTSWCSSESPGSKGANFPGSRHYLHTCIDGDVFIEECMDFRQEICVFDQSYTKDLFEYQTTSINWTNYTIYGKGVCRPNRWQDCYLQSSESSCEDDNSRDCIWDDPSVIGNQPLVELCIPKIAPGFRFWESQGMDVCSIGNDYRTCDGMDFSCPYQWTSSLDYRCRSLGDCGNNYNTNGVLTQMGFAGTDDRIYSSSVYSSSSRNKQMTFVDHFINVFRGNTSQRSQNDMGGGEYDIIGKPYSKVLSYVSDYVAEASGWDICGDWFKCREILGIKIPETYIGHVVAATMCLPWSPPDDLTDMDCFLCDVNESQYPCTEYMCKSLGRECLYYYDYVSGKGVCSKATADVTKFNLTFESVSGGLNFTGDDLTTSALANLGYLGIQFNESFRPNEYIELKYNTSFNATCFTLPYPPELLTIPSIPMIPFFSSVETNFSTEHTLQITLPDYDELLNKTLDALNISNLLELSTFVRDVELYFDTYPQIKSALDDAQNKGTTSLGVVNNYTKIKNDAPLAIALLGNLSEEITVYEPEITLYMFVVCQTPNGLINDHPTLDWYPNLHLTNPPNFDYLKIVVNQSVNDTTPPEIVKVSPANNSNLSTDFIELLVYTNEPAECRISDVGGENFFHETFISGGVGTIGPSVMPMECSRGGLDVLEGNVCSLELNTTLLSGGTKDYYISCRDQPKFIDEYSFQIINKTGAMLPEINSSPNFGNKSYVEYNLTTNAVHLRNAYYISNSSVGNLNATILAIDPSRFINISVQRNQPSFCFYGNDPNDIFWEQTESTFMMGCVNTTCSVENVFKPTLTPLTPRWNVKCIPQFQFGKNQNEMPNEYVYTLSRQ